MKYSLDITDSYLCLIIFSELSGINFYISLPEFKDNHPHECSIYLENIGINMDEQIWRRPILSQNPNSIIKIDEDLVILLKHAVLKIDQIRSYDLEIYSNHRVYNHSSGLNFIIGDRHIPCLGYSLDFENTVIYNDFIFSGKVFLEFEEEDIIIQNIGYDFLLGGMKEINILNNDADKRVKERKNVFNPQNFNKIQSPIWNSDFYRTHFLSPDGICYTKAVKNFNYLDVK